MKTSMLERFIRLVAGILLVSTLVPGSLIAGEPLPFFHDARSMALGNADLLVQPSLTMGWTNPALTAGSGFRIYIPAYQFRINTRTLKTFNFIKDNAERFAYLEELTPEAQQAFYDDMEPFDDQFVDVNNDLACGFYLGGLGLLVQAQTGVGIKLDRGIYTPAVGLKGNLLVGVTLSYGTRITAVDAVGISLTPLFGKTLSPTRFSAGDISEPSNAQSKFFDALGDSSVATGFSSSLGYTRDLASGMQVGASITDLFASYDGQSYKPQISAGITGTLANAVPEQYTLARRVIWMASWDDILNLNGHNLFSRLHFGTEIALPLLHLRAGVNQGYLTCGFGLRFKVITLDYTIYGQETGRKPGLGQDYSHVIQLCLGWN